MALSEGMLQRLELAGEGFEIKLTGMPNAGISGPV
jgi:hypothetical protein